MFFDAYALDFFAYAAGGAVPALSIRRRYHRLSDEYRTGGELIDKSRQSSYIRCYFSVFISGGSKGESMMIH